MKTIEDALAYADTFNAPANKHMSIVMLASEVRRLRKENERLADDMERCYRMLLSEPDVNHLETLRRAGLIEHERGFRGNFVKKPL